MFDIGVNLTSSQFAKDRDDVVARAFDAGVNGLLITGTNLRESQQAQKLARQYSSCWSTAGVHPHDSSQWQAVTEEAIIELGVEFYSMAEGTSIDKLIRALVGVILFQSAYVAEVVRGGLQALPKGQYEAAESLALGYWKTQGLVILPQALKLVIPGLVNTIIALFKDTSLVIIIGLFDLFSSVQQATVDPAWLGMSTEGYVFAALIYWIFCFSMSRYSQHLEKRFNTGRTPH